MRLWNKKTGRCTAVASPLPGVPQAIFMLSEQLILVQCKKACLLWRQSKLQRTFGCKREISGSAVFDNELFLSEQGLSLSCPLRFVFEYLLLVRERRCLHALSSWLVWLRFCQYTVARTLCVALNLRQLLQVLMHCISSTSDLLLLLLHLSEQCPALAEATARVCCCLSSTPS